MYPYIPLIALEASYDFSIKYEHDETLEKFFTGGKLTQKQMKKVDKILNPQSAKKEPCKVWEKNETIHTVSIRQMTEEEKELYKPLPLEPVSNSPDDFERIDDVKSEIVNAEELSNQHCKII